MADTADAHRPTTATMGRDELNLIDFPIGTLTYQQPRGPDGRLLDELVCSVDSFDEEVGRVVPKKVTTRTSSRFGFPTPKEEQLLVGLMLLSRLQNNFSSPRIHFLNSELLQLMGWADNGNSRRQLKEGLDRLQGVDLKYENSWSTQDGAHFHKEFKTRILDSYKLTSLRSGRPDRERERSWVQWSAEVYADIRQGNVKELNTQEFFSLKRPLSQRLYRFLDKHLAASGRFEMELLTLAGHLGMSGRHIGKVRARLREPIAELERLPRFIRRVADCERYHRISAGHWLIRFERETTAVASSPKPQTGSDESNHAARLVREFYRLWAGTESHRPSAKELAQAIEVKKEFGADVEELLPRVIKLMKAQFPDARSFGAAKTYWSAAAEARRKACRVKQQETAHRAAEQQDGQLRQQQRQRKQMLRDKWEQLDPAEHNRIRDVVRKTADAYVRRQIAAGKLDDPLVELACLHELERRLAG